MFSNFSESLNSLKKIKPVSFVIAILCVLAMQPYFIWGKENIVVISHILLTALLLFHLDITKKQTKYILLFFLIIYITLGIRRGASVFGLVLYIPCALLPCIKANCIKEIYSVFKLLLALLFLFSIISLIFVVLGLQSPKAFIEPLNDLKNHNYLQYFCLIIPGHVEGFGRFCSVFDEPGCVGTVAALFLIIENFNLRTFSNIIILTAGLLSFSLFFYIIIFIYILIKISTIKKVLLLVVVTILYFTTKNNDFFNKHLWNRLEYSDEYGFQGNNRNSDDLLELWDTSKKNVEILFGYGSKYIENYTTSASIQLFILRDGLLFVLFFFLLYFALSRIYLKRYKDIWLYILCIFLTLYQRPGFCSIDFCLLFISYLIIRSNNLINTPSKYASLSYSDKL